MGLVSVGIAVWYTGRPTKSPQDMLLRLIVFCLTVFTSVWALDGVLAYRTDLLLPEERAALFATVKDTTGYLLAFYFGTKINKNEN